MIFLFPQLRSLGTKTASLFCLNESGSAHFSKCVALSVPFLLAHRPKLKAYSQPTKTLNQLSGQSCSQTRVSSFQIPEFFISQNDQGMQSHFRLRCHYFYQFKMGLYKLL